MPAVRTASDQHKHRGKRIFSREPGVPVDLRAGSRETLFLFFSAGYCVFKKKRLRGGNWRV